MNTHDEMSTLNKFALVMNAECIFFCENSKGKNVTAGILRIITVHLEILIQSDISDDLLSDRQKSTIHAHA